MEALWVCTLARDGRAQGDTARVHKDLDDKVLGHKMVPGGRVLAHTPLHGTVSGHTRVLDGTELGHMTVPSLFSLPCFLFYFLGDFWSETTQGTSMGRARIHFRGS